MSDLPQLLTRADVAQHLGVELRKLTWWVWGLNEHRRYDEFEIPRRSGGPPRPIQAPIKPIKDLQRQLIPLLEAGYTPRTHVHGFVRTRSALTNANIHRNQRWVLRIDLQDFFPSIHFGRVRGVFNSYLFEYSPEVATLLAQICCHQQRLPQGAPTSPILSNLICRGLDKQLALLARSRHCHYSRYADDMCFSTGRKNFPEDIATKHGSSVVLGRQIRSVIESNDFKINEAKTRLMPRGQRQRVTGLVVNTRTNVPREYRRFLRVILHIWAKYGEVAASKAFEESDGGRYWPPEKPGPEFRLTIRGRLQYLGATRGYDRVYQQMAARLMKCDPTFKPTLPQVPEPGHVVFATEGPSDPKHLQAAVRALAKVTSFPSLDLREVSHQPPRGEAKLWKWLNEQKDVPSTHPRLGVFDSDSNYRQKVGADGWKHLGNGVVAIVLAPPDWRQPGDSFCIEMLHTNETLQMTDSAGRRIFLRDEFDAHGLSHDGNMRMKYPSKRALVVDHVHDVAAGASMALGKVAFAEQIWTGQPPFGDVDFRGFAPTRDRIWRAIAVAQTWCS